MSRHTDIISLANAAKYLADNDMCDLMADTLALMLDASNGDLQDALDRVADSYAKFNSVERIQLPKNTRAI